MPKDKDEKIDLTKMEEEEAAPAAPTAVGKLPALIEKFKSQVVKLLSYSVAAILIILIAVYISYIVAKNVTISPIAAREGKIHYPPEPPLGVFDLGEIRINTADKDEPHFLRIELVLAYPAKDMRVANELSARRAQILNIVNTILMSKTKDELLSYPDKLRTEIKEAVNNVMQYKELRDVYIKSIAIG